MIEPFADPAWADAHEKLSADMAAGFAHLACWLRRGAKAMDDPPAATPHRGQGRGPQRRAPLADARRISAKTAAPPVSGALRPPPD